MSESMPDRHASDRSSPESPGLRPSPDAAVLREWSQKDTRCAVCFRKFPTAEDIERHAEKECDPDPCWCWSLCWVEHGGDCNYPDELGDDLAVYLALRAAEERGNLLAWALHHLVEAHERLSEDFVVDRIQTAKSVLADVGPNRYIGQREDIGDAGAHGATRGGAVQ